MTAAALARAPHQRPTLMSPLIRNRDSISVIPTYWYAPPLLSIADALIHALTSIILALAAIRVTGIIALAAAGLLVMGALAVKIRRRKRG
ncbi:hypothetical protein FZC33_04115 [Labrys sp. KNU-23]|uniref:hypothetical protein n=1 Tax=Labrys sp. KNU-23 TaxID=2789216 RepID=UPI0011EF4F70|nr:hypothetical protein [Labrys sp. KNU-23]QEN85439.1 hypothetical protein FZC33_04115 [Labrys sp. KNU-23]